MKKLIVLTFLLSVSFAAFSQKGEWVDLFNGKNLDGWKVTEENPSSFKVEDGVIKVDGKRAHLFYDGKVGDHNFENFELKAEVKTMPKANSGIFIHTTYQPSGWPNKGYEIQVNQSHGDVIKSGSVYNFKNVKEVHVKDEEWYTYHIIVMGDKVTVKLNDKVVSEYDQSEDTNRPADAGEKKFDRGTIALQAHDPESVIFYKNIKLKILD